MSTRTKTLPQDLLTHLQLTYEGFGALPAKQQWSLAHMVWMGNERRRQHHVDESAMSFTWRELEQFFGRAGFKQINDRLGMFEVSPNWSKQQGITKSYRLSEKLKACRALYFSCSLSNSTQLVMETGKVLKTLPRAIASQDMSGKTVKQSNSIAACTGLNSVPVDVKGLQELYQRLTEMMAAMLDQPASGKSAREAHIPLAVLERTAEATAHILKLAHVDVTGPGFVMHSYQECSSGRLYAHNVNLQQASKLVKQVALKGLWEYDFSNCHFAILCEMARRQDYQCSAISNYLENKIAVRETIARKASITVQKTKSCLIALMYSARLSDWHANAIPMAIGPDGAKRLFKVAEFTGIHADICQARKKILSAWPRTANASLTNAHGKAISGKASAAQKLAHLIQGVERAALNAALNLNPKQIVLLQHDGFAARARLDLSQLEHEVVTRTGYQIALEEARIVPDFEAFYAKYTTH